ncbi:Catalase [Monocercomonoides exilis]|uniref:Catalase n=1 Tax=Monocercomonoides exilis TaxID=2049356 RepID=UPI0035594D99|nr:Catalase [Monocercomonoides exilis]|eukprot:MONOS_5950.1-p1 / transcript=MONOS_5950.1 / gene=MONOS_5950 / organism=Monocercomonoides_exilis_PA203 / gene_product=Catalase / transcript_product=Catalase / location=Mono_scaffold00180:16978-19410(+) / protein_length=811 / sequence_SO=supercontig / SO=protein_coding / is_pseudo=false
MISHCFFSISLILFGSIESQLWKFGPTTKPPAENEPPFHDGKSAEPHYDDLIPEGANTVTPKPTPPGTEPTAPGSLKEPENVNKKLIQMDRYRVDDTGKSLTSNTGIKISNNQAILKIGERGPELLEDVFYFDKLQHFNRERIPERVVHARGTGVHGYFQVYKSLSKITKANFLQDPTKKTPVFVRFSTVQGSRGSADTVRDVRGLAVKFYTDEGIYDLLSLNVAVFFVQDSMKFMDFIHALKPEPHAEIPQAQTAHDTFWDYISLQPESLHTVMWAMSDRALPRSYSNFEAFGVHSFRMINEEGKAVFVRFHWKPVLGKSSLVWDEAQLVQGRDPDFNRKELWQSIEAGDYPEYELGLQIIPEEDKDKFGFDIMDPTKLIPEAIVPVEIVGKMTLNRNPDNFFSETEQVAFSPGNLVPGIDLSEDPLLQGRAIAYHDTQRHRLGTNFHLLPINSPVSGIHNHQRDGYMQSTIPKGSNYEPNSISENWPREAPVQGKQTEADYGRQDGSKESGGRFGKTNEHKMPRNKDEVGGGFSTYGVHAEGFKTRTRSPSFQEYYSQPRLFYISQTPSEQKHIIDAFGFELSRVSRPYIRERVVDHLCRVDKELAKNVSEQLGIKLTEEQMNYPLPEPVCGLTEGDPALSQYKNNKIAVKGRRVNVVVADGVDGATVDAIVAALKAEGVHPLIVATKLGEIKTNGGSHTLVADDTFKGRSSVLTDAVIVPDGDESIATLLMDGDAQHQVAVAYRHLKPISFVGRAKALLAASGLKEDPEDKGIILNDSPSDTAKNLVTVMKEHRVWDREPKISSVKP